MPFELRIELSGLCLFVLNKDGNKVRVLMPDARRKPSMEEMVHSDDTTAVPHAGYLRFDLGNLLPDIPPAFANGVGPRYEGVHRFDREELDLGLGNVNFAVDSDELTFPDFKRIDDTFTVAPGMFGNAPPPQLLMRTTLTGGKFTTHSGGSNWFFPDSGSGDGGVYQGQFANYAVWRREIHQDELKLTIAPFGAGTKTPKTHLALRPHNGVIQLKIANLCAENPLEWPELKIRTIAGEEDLDFKWLYSLLAAPETVPVGTTSLPVPVLDRTSGAAGEEADCTGGKIVDDNGY